jgi:glycosyltransferase involved in cell wall biosynthesis
VATTAARPETHASPAIPGSLVRPAPLVSIGLPVYNGAEFVRDAIASLVGQTYPNLELVISDNGSTDETEAICREAAAADARIRYHRSPVNRGLIWNWRNALALSTGPYFMWAAHDDFFGPAYVEQCVAALESRPRVPYVLAVSALMDAEGHDLGLEETRQRLDHPSPSIRFWDMLVVRGGTNFYGLFRRQALDRIAPYRTVPRGERLVLAELLLWGPFHLLTEKGLYVRRVHDAQATTLRRDRRAEIRLLDPERAASWRGSVPAVLLEYVGGFILAILRAPLSPGERVRALARLGRWMLGHVPGLGVRDERARTVRITGGDTRFLPEGRGDVGY